MSEVEVSFITQMEGGENGQPQNEENWHYEDKISTINSEVALCVFKIPNFKIYALRKIIPKYYLL